MGAILSHITLGVSDIARATAFYDAVLSELGIARGKSGDGFAGWGSPHECGLLHHASIQRQPASVGNGVSVSFLAPTRDAVDRFHAKAMALGATDEGKPSVRSHYHANYYAAYLRDPDGNKIAAVCHDAMTTHGR